MASGYRSQQAFGEVMNLHRTTVTKIENGTRHVTGDVLRKWCEVCHLDFELYEASARLAWVTEESPVPPWFQDFFRAQTLSHTIRTWHPGIVPGLLQTADYTRALHEGAGTSDELADERIAARLDLQQQTLERRPVPVTLLAVLNEAALHCRIGPEEVRHRQLLHLIEQGKRRHIGIQVVPAIRGVHGQFSAFTIASMDDADVMLTDAIEDVTTDQRPMIRTGLAIFDRVRLDALSGPESLELITKVAEGCKP
jgi:hypothetical protein